MTALAPHKTSSVEKKERVVAGNGKWFYNTLTIKI
jgi:hypothetical protein